MGPEALLAIGAAALAGTAHESRVAPTKEWRPLKRCNALSTPPQGPKEGSIGQQRLAEQRSEW